MSGAEITASALSALANLILAGAAVSAAIAAFKGLNTWKNQSVWAADNDLARRTLVALYRYRESLFAVRHPAMYNGEMKVDDTDAAGLTDDQVRQKGIILAYARRWERHQAIESDLHAILQEVDAVWGKELSTKVSALKALQRELFAYIRLHLDAHYRGSNSLADSYKEILRTRRDILYDMMSEDDIFRVDFENSMKPVEAYLRGKLGRET